MHFQQAKFVVAFLATHPPDQNALEAFARERNGTDVEDFVGILISTHAILSDWFARVGEQQIGILHLSY